MSNIPYKANTSQDDDEEDEIVSFEAFCDDRSPGKGKADTLTLNDNINYRLYYESDHPVRSNDNKDAEGSSKEEKETSLNGPKSVSWKRKNSSSFAPFGRYCPRANKGSYLSNVIPKPTRADSSESEGREHRYRRFSANQSFIRRICDNLPSLGSGFLLLALLSVLSVGVWWAVYGAIGEAWSEEHYRKLWERAHPEREKPPHYFPGAPHPEPDTDSRFHDHNNLSTKNRMNATENVKKKSDIKKGSAFTEKPILGEENLCSNVKDEYRFDCYPEAGSNEEGCLQRGCCWKPQETLDSDKENLEEKIGLPYCFYPPQYNTYRFINMTENKHGVSIVYQKQRDSAYPNNFEFAKFDIRYLSDDALQIKIYDPEIKRFEPPLPEITTVPSSINNLQYRVFVEGSRTGFKVVRTADNSSIFDSQNVGGLILSDKFLQLSAILPPGSIFGLGERRGRYQLDMNWQRLTIFNRDTVPNEDTNLYGYQPFYISMEDTGLSHGVLLLNSNAMDIILQPTPAITYRTIGGVLNFFIFLGPKPVDVISQYTALVGRPFMPPYWSLGFHLCKFNYGSVNVTRDVWKSNRNAGIPFDVQWNDLDYMNNSNDFTYDKVKFAGLPDFVKELHSAGMHYIPLIDPGISQSEPRGEYPPFDRGLEMNVFIKNQTMQPFVGKVWNKGSTVWPDFTHPNGTAYWVEMMKDYHKQVPFDGAWIDMNEPSNFLDGPMYGSCLPEDLPYQPHIAGNNGLKSKTLCMDAIHFIGKHYDLHTMYSLTEAVATNFALQEIRGNRPFIISRSSFVGLGRYAGHWSGDIASDWHDMQMTIPELLSFTTFGVSMMGADICGFRGNTTVELCKRWMQLGAFYPFARNHNSDSSSPQDPVSLGPEVVEASRSSLRLRYEILPYLYTMFWRADIYGEPLAQPLFFQYPLDKVTYPIDSQYMLGPQIMIAPILTAGAKSVRVYLPRQIWYRLNETATVPFSGWGTLNEDETVLVKGGSVIALQKPPSKGPVSTAVCRSRPIQLLVAPCDMKRAHGELYWDSGDGLNTYDEKKYSHIKFHLSNNKLESQAIWWGIGVPSVNTIYLLNQEKPAKEVLVNNKTAKFTYDSDRQKITVQNLTLVLNEKLIVTWS